jgi:hypothetical protein
MRIFRTKLFWYCRISSNNFFKRNVAFDGRHSSIFFSTCFHFNRRRFFFGWNRQKSESKAVIIDRKSFFPSEVSRRWSFWWNFNRWFSCESLTKNSVILLYLPHLLFKYWSGLVSSSLSKVQHIVSWVKIISHWAIKEVVIKDASPYRILTFVIHWATPKCLLSFSFWNKSPK